MCVKVWARRASASMRLVLVKVGAGHYCRVQFDRVMEMDRADLLAALAQTVIFCVSLRGVPLDACAVHVCASATEEEPSTEESRRACELRGAKALGALAAGLGAGNLFVHVVLATRAGAGGGGESAGALQGPLVVASLAACWSCRRAPSLPAHWWHGRWPSHLCSIG